jgi:hypothetical protein
MRHLRSDYDQIQDPSGKIGDDELVFLLRAQDLAAPATVEVWSRLAEAYGSDPGMTRQVRRFAREMRDWQQAHAAKVPDVPPVALRQLPDPQVDKAT